MRIKLVGWSIVFAAALSCTREEPVESVAPSVEVSFNLPAVRRPTKSSAGAQDTEMPSSYNRDEHFSVYALLQAKPFSELSAGEKNFTFMDRVDCAYLPSAGGWVASGEDQYYWPKGPWMLTFQAFSPSVVTEDGTLSHSWTGGFSLTGFTMRPSGEQYDLLFTRRHEDKKRPDYVPASSEPYDELPALDKGSWKGIDLQFHHALSSVEFRIRSNTNEGAKQVVRLRSIRVLNVRSSGSFSQNLHGDGSASPVWDTSSSGQDDYTVFDAATDPDGARIITTDYYTAKTHALMPIPQPLEHGSDGNVKAEVIYTRTTGATTVTTKEVVDLSGLSVTEWEIGCKYVYKISIGLHKVFLDPTVVDWADGGGTEIDI